MDKPAGVPGLEDFLSAYFHHLEGRTPCAQRMADLTKGHQWRWFVCLALFRVAAILAGVGSRAKAGNASARNASVVGSRKVVSGVVDTAIGLITTEDLGEGDPSGLNYGLLKHRARIFAEKVLLSENLVLKHSNSEAKWTPHPVMEKLKRAGQLSGLWNCFLSHDLVSQARMKLEQGGLHLEQKEWAKLLGPGLSNREYVELAEIMGRSPFSIEALNCSAPDTGNMEVLIRHGTVDQCKKWLLPLLRGRSGAALP